MVAVEKSMISFMEIGERILLARKHAGLNKAALGRAAGVTRQAIGAMENGTSKNPQADHLLKIAQVTGVNLIWLISGRGEMLSGTQVAEYFWRDNRAEHFALRRIKMLDDKEVLEWMQHYQVGPVAESNPEKETFIFSDAPERAFGMYMEGDTMTDNSPESIPDGAVVYIDPDAIPKHGSIVVAYQKGSESVMIKKLVTDGPNRYLKTLNSQYSMIKMDDDFEIIGVVFQSSRITNHTT